jgi:hypothetical protein
MNTPPSPSPRRRLQELLAIPDNQRSEAEWDELIELEIKLAPGNRADAPGQGGGGGGGGKPSAGQGGNPKPHQNPNPNPGGGQGKKPFKKFHKKPPKPNPQSSS